MAIITELTNKKEALLKEANELHYSGKGLEAHRKRVEAKELQWEISRIQHGEKETKIKVSSEMKRQLVTIALFGCAETQRTLTALGKRDLAHRISMHDEFECWRGYALPAELTLTGWKIVAKYAQERFDSLAEYAFKQPGMRHELTRLENHIELMNTYGSIVTRAGWKLNNL